MTIGDLIAKIARLKELQEKEENEGLNHIEFCEMLRIRDTEIKVQE